MPYAVERSTQLRQARQSRLASADPIELHAIINEDALRRMVSGPAVMHDQLAHLVTMLNLPNIRADHEHPPRGAGPCELADEQSERRRRVRLTDNTSAPH